MFFRRIKVADFDFNEKCRNIAAATEGLSGREIAKLGVAWQVSYLWLGFSFLFISIQTCLTIRGTLFFS